MTTPDAALLWARELMAQQYEGDEEVAGQYRTGYMDNCCQELADLATGFRAGQSHDTGLLAAHLIDIAALKRVRLWAEHGLRSDLSDLTAAVSHINALEAAGEAQQAELIRMAQHAQALEAALKEVIADCPSCHGEGSFLEYDNVTGKNLWTDCAPCSRARAAIAAAKGGRDAG